TWPCPPLWTDDNASLLSYEFRCEAKAGVKTKSTLSRLKTIGDMIHLIFRGSQNHGEVLLCKFHCLVLLLSSSLFGKESFFRTFIITTKFYVY
uniref:Uncharacterized protein n=1 Tax=Aegilops tauschii subsp. strangulata TaxID=200361 RepID=A0A453Q064_AEGTS